MFGIGGWRILMCETEYKIVQEHGHYVVYIDDEFYCSADNWHEAAKEIQEHLNKERSLC